MKEWSRLKKTVVISAVTILGISGISSLASPQQNAQVANPDTGSSATTIAPPKVQSETTQNTESPVQAAPVTSTPAQTSDNQSDSSSAVSCPNGTYVNTDGITVCSPYSAPTSPAGATAQCVDGTYSFSLHHSGTCSHHGGVATWL